MKIILYLLIFASLTLVGSCKKFDEKTQFDITINETVEIPSIVGVNLPFNLPTTSIHTEINEQLEIKDKKKEKIEYINLTELKLSILNPSNKNFNFLKAVEVYISAENLPEILVAKEDNMPNANAQEVYVSPIEKLDLTEYVKKDAIDLKVVVTTDETIFQKVTIDVQSSFWIDAKVLGI